MNLSLFDISQEFYALKDLIENDLEVNEETGEITDNSELLKEFFNNLTLTMEDKFDNTQRYILTLNSEAETLDKEIKRLQVKKVSLNNKSDKLRAMMQNALNVAGIEKFKTPLYSFSVKSSQSVEVINLDDVPRSYLRIKKEADKVAIKKAINDGLVVNGCEIRINKSLGVK